MSESTFSAPTSATAGLQPYNLERGVKALYPATIAGLLRRHRHVAAGRRNAKRGALGKDTPMPQLQINAMVGTLQASVLDILAKAAPDQQAGLIRQTFTEFTAATEGDLAKFADGAGGDEPLYKGLGCVGRVAELVRNLATQIAAIKEGRETWGPSYSDGKPKKDDPASDEVGELLDGALHVGELALRAAVNEHVEILEDGDDGDGYRLIRVPSADAPDDETAAVVVKTDLPEDLAKFATDPGLLQQMALESSIGMAIYGGVKPQRLEKALGIEGLAKAFPPKEGEEDEEDEPADEGEGEGEGEGGDAEFAQGAEDVDAAPMEGEEADSPLDLLGRLLAASMIQLTKVQQMLEGDAEMGAEGAPAGAGAPPPPPPSQGEEDVRKGGEATGELLKLSGLVAEMGGVENVAGMLRKMAVIPEAPKAATMDVAAQLAKLAEAEGGDPRLAKGADGYSEADLEDLRKRDPDKASLIDIKRAQGQPMVVGPFQRQPAASAG